MWLEKFSKQIHLEKKFFVKVDDTLLWNIIAQKKVTTFVLLLLSFSMLLFFYAPRTHRKANLNPFNENIQPINPLIMAAYCSMDADFSGYKVSHFGISRFITRVCVEEISFRETLCNKYETY